MRTVGGQPILRQGVRCALAPSKQKYHLTPISRPNFSPISRETNFSTSISPDTNFFILSFPLVLKICRCCDVNFHGDVNVQLDVGVLTCNAVTV